MEHADQQHGQNAQNLQTPHNTQQQQHQNAQEPQTTQNTQDKPGQLLPEGYQQPRKRITKTPPDADSCGANKRPSGHSGRLLDQPPIPERTSSYPGYDTLASDNLMASKSQKPRSQSIPMVDDSRAALTAAELLKTGSMDLQVGEDDSLETVPTGAVGSGDADEESEATEFGDAGDTETASDLAQASFATRKGKGKGKGKNNGKKKQDAKMSRDRSMAGAAQEGRQHGPDGGSAGGPGGRGKPESMHRHGCGTGGDGGSDDGSGRKENPARTASLSQQHFVEEDVASGDTAHGHQGRDESNVINLNNFPANTRPNGARLHANTAGGGSSNSAWLPANAARGNGGSGSPTSWAFASITNILAGMVSPPRATRDDYMHAILASDRPTLQQVVQSLAVSLQSEQARLIAAEEEVDVLKTNIGVYKDLAMQFREEAVKLREETERYKKGHNQVLRDLNRFKAGQYFSQMSDDFLTQQALQLRQDIRDFSLQYFVGEFEDAAKNASPPAYVETKLGEYMQGISPLDPFKSFLLSPTRCSSAVESFLWVILAKTVFGGWYWAGSGRLPLHDMFSWIRPANNAFAMWNEAAVGAAGVAGATDAKSAGAVDPEAERRFYTWRASTAKLVLERPGIEVRENLRKKLIEELCATISPYLRNSDGSHEEELMNIVNKAIEFDRETSQQASCLEWMFCRTPGQADRGEPVHFNDSAMDIQMWEETPTEQSEVLLVVAPGLRKRGRSNGEDYAVESMLLKMDVTCEPVTDMIVT